MQDNTDTPELSPEEQPLTYLTIREAFNEHRREFDTWRADLTKHVEAQIDEAAGKLAQLRREAAAVEERRERDEARASEARRLSSEVSTLSARYEMLTDTVAKLEGKREELGLVSDVADLRSKLGFLKVELKEAKQELAITARERREAAEQRDACLNAVGFLAPLVDRLEEDPELARYLARTQRTADRFVAEVAEDRRIAKCHDADYRDAVLWREDAKEGQGGSLVVREHALMLEAVGDAEVERVVSLLGTGRVPAEVVRVIDGDTYLLRVRDEEFRIRTVGFDCPEVNKVGHALPEVCAQEATDSATALLRGQVEVQLDPVGLAYEAGPFVMDRYGRLLAHVYADGRLVGESLVEAGLARVVRGFPIDQATLDELTVLQGEAREAKAGLWQHVQRTRKTTTEVVREYDAAERQYTIRSVSAFLSSFTLSTDSGVLHVPGCQHIGRMKSPTSVSSVEEARELLSQIQNARPCKSCFRDEDNRAEAQDAIDAAIEEVSR